MKKFHYHPDFWEELDQLVHESQIIIDRPKGSKHPRFEQFVYPMDYGYLEGTTASDGASIDIWIGSTNEKKVTGVLHVLDLDKKDTEIKLLYNCSHEERMELYRINNLLMMHALLLER